MVGNAPSRTCLVSPADVTKGLTIAAQSILSASERLASGALRTSHITPTPGAKCMSEVKVLDHGYVKLIPDGCWGSDEIIIESARMSTNKGFQGWGPDPCDCCGGKGKLEHVLSSDTFREWSRTIPCTVCGGEPHKPGDEKLLRYLYEHKHMTPFEMAGMTVEVQAPIMVFREWHRHRTQSYNEMSGRYTELPDLYYVPSLERCKAGKQSKTNKQGSAVGFSDQEAWEIQQFFVENSGRCREQYEALLQLGISREIARLVLPVNQYSRMRASANLRNWLGFLTLRLDPAAQWEIRQYANAVAKFIDTRFPRTYSLFSEGK